MSEYSVAVQVYMVLTVVAIACWMALELADRRAGR